MSRAFDRANRSVDGLNRSITRNNAALGSNSKASAAAENGLLGLLTTVSGTNHGFTLASSKAGMFAKSLAAVNLATGVLEPVMAGLVVATAGLGSAAGIAGAGLGVYGIAAAGLIKQVGELQKQEAKLGQGSAATQKANRQLYEGMLKAAPPAVKAFNSAFDDMQHSYGKWTKALAAPVLAPLTKAMGLTLPLMRIASPLVRQTGLAIGTLVDELGRSIKGGGLERWVTSILPYVRPIILNLGRAIGHIVVGLGGIIKAFAPVSVSLTKGLDNITAKFAKWGQTLTSHSGFQSLMAMFRSQTPMAMNLLKNLGIIIGNVARATVGLASPANSKALLQLLTPLSQVMVTLSRNQALVRTVMYFLLMRAALNQLKPAFLGLKTGYDSIVGIGQAAYAAYGQIGRFAGGFRDARVAESAFSGTAGTLGGQLRKVAVWIGATTAAAAASSWAWIKSTAAVVANRVAMIASAAAARVMTAAQWLLNAAMTANPIGLVVVALAALGTAFYVAWTKSATFRKILIGAWNAIWAVGRTVFGWFAGPFVNFFTRTIPHTFGLVLSWVRRNWPWLLGALTGPIGLAVVWIVRRWGQLIGGIKAGWNVVVTFIKSIPGRILAALQGLGTSLWNFGHMALVKFWNGMKSVGNLLPGWVKTIGGAILGTIKKVFGIFSPSSVMYDMGRNLMLGLRNGIRDHLGSVRSAVTGPRGMGVAATGPVQQYAKKLLAAYGWGGQFPALNALIMGESGWRWNATNPSSGAYGIPQALPPGKMASAGADWRTNPYTQLRWMFGYIRSVYGSPARAYAMWLSRSPHWYDAGSWSVPATGPAVVHRGEMILPEALAAEVRAALTAPGPGATVNNYVTVQVGHGTHPAQAAREIAAVLNAGAASGVRLRRSILGPG